MRTFSHIRTFSSRAVCFSCLLAGLIGLATPIHAVAQATTTEQPAAGDALVLNPAPPIAGEPTVLAPASQEPTQSQELQDPPGGDRRILPVGVWGGGMTMLVVTTRAVDGKVLKEPWFGSKRATSPMAVRAILYPPSKSFLTKVNPLSNKGWSIAAVEPVDGPYDKAVAAQAEGRDVLLFVHGFNESFESASTSYAQLIEGIHFSGAPILFTWPSANALFDYVSDRDSALWSRDALEDTITALANDPKIGRIHIVAHSMGGLVVLEALRAVNDRIGSALSARIGAIVLANPDVDIDLFKRQMQRMAGLASKTTVIVSGKDRALALSSTIAGGFKRVGASDQDALGDTGVKVVDATDFGSGLIKHDMFITDVEVRGVVRRAIEIANGPT